MPWCPVCKAEYRQGFHVCPNCKVDLVDALESGTDQESKDTVIEKWVFLTEIMNDNEVDVIESLLQSQGILLLKKYKGAGEILKIYMGKTLFGIDLYVPASQWEDARVLIGHTPDQAGGHKSVSISSDKRDDRHGGQMKFVVAFLFVTIIIAILLQFRFE